MNEGWTGVAISGLALAVVSLLWQLWYSVRIDRPRLRARVTLGHIVTRAETLDVTTMTVTNVGRRATVLQSVTLAFGRPKFLIRLWPAQYRPRFLRGKQQIMVMGEALLPDLNRDQLPPKRLETGDEVNVYLPSENVRAAAEKAGTKKVHVIASATTARTVHSRPIRVIAPN